MIFAYITFDFKENLCFLFLFVAEIWNCSLRDYMQGIVVKQTLLRIFKFYSRGP